MQKQGGKIIFNKHRSTLLAEGHLLVRKKKNCITTGRAEHGCTNARRCPGRGALHQWQPALISKHAGSIQQQSAKRQCTLTRHQLLEKLTPCMMHADPSFSQNPPAETDPPQQMGHPLYQAHYAWQTACSLPREAETAMHVATPPGACALGIDRSACQHCLNLLSRRGQTWRCPGSKHTSNLCRLYMASQ